MAESWMDVLGRHRKKSGKKLTGNVNILVLRPPSQAMGSMRYTGAGANGVVEPNKPAMLDTSVRPAAVYHEGEMVVDDAVGRKVIPNNQLITPKTEQGQQQLGHIQRINMLPGFATGGYSGYNTGMPDWIQDATSESQTQKTTTPGASVSPIELTNLGNNRDLVMNTLKPGVPVYDQGVYRGETTGTGGVKVPTGVNQGLVTPLMQPPQISIQAPQQSQTATTQGQVTPITQPPQISVMAPAQVNTQTATGTQTTPSTMYKAGAEEGYSRIRDIARSESEAANLARQKTLNYLDTSAASNNAATIQRLRSQGWSDNDIQTYMAQQSRGQQTTRAQTAADLGIAEAQRAEGAARDLATLGRSAYESDRSFDYKKTMDAVNLLTDAGGAQNYQQAAKLLNQTLGTDIDFSTKINDSNYAQFGQGLNNLQSLAAVYDWDNVPQNVKQNLMTALGVGDVELGQMFNGLKTNAVDEQFAVLRDSQFYQNLDGENRAIIDEAMQAVYLGQLGIVREEDGTLRFVGADTPLTKSTVKVPEGVDVGDYFVDKKTGDIYKSKGTSAPEKQEYNTATMDPYSADAERILSLGEGSAYYNDIVAKRNTAQGDVTKYSTSRLLDTIYEVGGQTTDPTSGDQKIILPVDSALYKEAAARSRTLATYSSSQKYGQIAPRVDAIFTDPNSGYASAFNEVAEGKDHLVFIRSDMVKSDFPKNDEGMFIPGLDEGDVFVTIGGRTFYVEPKGKKSGGYFLRDLASGGTLRIGITNG